MMYSRPIRLVLWTGCFWASVTGCMDAETRSNLLARSPTKIPGASCNACHPYPLQDIDHTFHNNVGNVKIADGVITCLECHFTSIQSHPFALVESLFTDSAGHQYSSLEMSPSDPARLLPLTLFRVDTFHQEHPDTLFATHRPPDPSGVDSTGLLEWVTGLAHFNGRVDVVFSPEIADTIRYGEKPVYDAKEETCSAVKCHVQSDPYRFPALSKGLSGLP